MAPGAKPPSRTAKKSTNFKRQKMSQSIPLNLLANIPSTSGNRFSALADNAEMDLEAESNIVEPRQTKPPPVVVESSTSLTELQKMLGKDYIYKRTSIGTKIFPPSNDKLEHCKKMLLDKKIAFHSFSSKENRLYTTFIYGLPKVSTDDIINDLKEYNLTPASVTEIKTKYSSLNNAVYKVQFVRKSFNPQSLQKIRNICNVIITWKKHKQRKNDNPTQCWNCLMYGHGGEHCHRLPACMICANNHHTTECPLNNRERKPAVFTCFNCKKGGKERTDHPANDVNCPFRATYLENRAKATSNISRSNNIMRSTTRVNPPHFSPSVQHNATPNTQSYINGKSFASCLRENNDLFSIDELFEIFMSALNDLQQCTSKVQQIQIVMSMVKYAHGLR